MWIVHPRPLISSHLICTELTWAYRQRSLSSSVQIRWDEIRSDQLQCDVNAFYKHGLLLFDHLHLLHFTCTLYCFFSLLLLLIRRYFTEIPHDNAAREQRFVQVNRFGCTICWARAVEIWADNGRVVNLHVCDVTLTARSLLATCLVHNTENSVDQIRTSPLY